MSHPYAVPNSASASSYQSYDYTSQPSYSSPRPRQPPPPASPPPSGLPRLPPSASASSDAGRYRSRGESSPAMSSQGGLPNGAERDSYFGGAEGLSRRPSSGPGERTRRLNADGTEETREQRRERKEWERASRGLTASASTATSSATPAAPTSKSVLTVALQRAQSAVLLDSANNVPAAIAAYQQSVRLLREVMRRVDEGTRLEREREAQRERRRQAGNEEERETSAEREQRVQRIERRQRAKQDEARRLQVIHDTYEDRIKMLLAMPNATDPSAEPDAPATPTTPNSTATFQPSPTSTNTFAGRTPQPHRASRSISSLNTVTTAPATFAYQTSAPAPAVVVKGSALELEEDEADQTAAGIGAMMLGSEPASTMVEETPGGLSPTVGDDRAERNGSVSSQGTITAGQAFAIGHNGGRSSASPPQQSQVAFDRRAPTDDFLEFSPTSTQSHSSGSPTLPSIEFTQDSERAARQRSESNSSVESEGPVPVTALEYGADWPTSHSPVFASDAPVEALGDEPQPAQAEQAFEGISTDATVPEPQRSSLIGRDFATFLPTSANMGRSGSAQTAASSQTMHRLASSESMARQASGESFMSGRTSASLFGGHQFPGEQQGRPRPSRSASLQVGQAPSLVSATTSAGLISQRRSRPAEMARTGSSAGVDGLQSEAVAEEEEGEDTVRLSQGSSRWEQSTEFGSISSAASGHASSASGSGLGPGSFISSSLPTRIRALSQPGKRPGLMQYESERPAMPTMLAQTARSVSVSGASMPRKMSLGGAGLQAPYPTLGRTASGSSVGDGTPLTAHFGNKAGYAHGGVNLMLGPPPMSASELAPVTPVRRPFQLMNLLLASIAQGGHLSARLYVPKQAWTLSGVKLAQVEAKVRMLEPLSDTLTEVKEAGEYLLPPPSGGPAWEGYRADPTNRARYLRALENLEGIMDGLQATLHKKLGDAVAPSAGKKAGGAGFAAWGSKLSRSLDRVTNGRSLDSPAAYVDALSRVFGLAQVLDWHLVYLLEGGAGYEGMDEESRRRVEARLRRASEFFSQTVCRFVLRDVGMLMDKYLKRQGHQMCAE